MIYDKISLQRLETLHPKIRAQRIADYKECCEKVFNHRITYALRTAAEQDYLYAQGRTRPGPIVTYAKAWQSIHNFGFADDFCLLLPGSKMWDTKYDDPNDTDLKSEWIEIVEFYEKRGYESGIRWKKPYDPPHLQKTFGHTWQSLNKLRLAGKVDKQGYVII